MAKKRREIEKIIAGYIRNLNSSGVEVTRIILYGSYARGKPKEYSDIDIAVVSPAFNKMDIFERQEILSKAHHRFGEPIEAIGFTPDQLRGKEGFIREIIENGITLYKK
jgi:predicted nucleotidyltransferase